MTEHAMTPRDLAEWLAAMDAPESAHRRTVTLTEIIKAAKDSLAGSEPRRYVTTKAWKPDIGPGRNLDEAIILAVADGTLVREPESDAKSEQDRLARLRCRCSPSVTAVDCPEHGGGI